MEIKFKRYSENTIIPMTATTGSDGYDLYSAVNTSLVPFKPELVKTDIMLEIPKYFYAKVVGSSSLALSGVSTHVGTLDLDFWGVACVILTKTSQGVEHQIKKGDRIGQIIFEKNEIVKLSQCSIDEELSKTDRGSKCFASAGK